MRTPPSEASSSLLSFMFWFTEGFQEDILHLRLPFLSLLNSSWESNQHSPVLDVFGAHHLGLERSLKTKQKQTNSQTAPPSNHRLLVTHGGRRGGGISLLMKSFSAHVGKSAGEASAILTTLWRVHGCHIPVLARRYYHLSATPVLRLLKSRLRTTGSPPACPHLTGRGKEQQGASKDRAG